MPHGMRVPALLLLPLLLGAACDGASGPEPRTRIAFALQKSALDSDIMLIDPDGGNPEPVSPHKALDETPCWTPGGDGLLFAADTDTRRGLYLWEDGKLTAVSTALSWMDRAPAWSPDGTEIAFASNRDGNWEIYVMDPGGRKVRRLTEGDPWDQWPAWSPDGRWIAFVSDRDGQPDLFIMDAQGDHVQPLTRDRAWDGRPAWSPDGKRLAWGSDKGGTLGVWTMELTRLEPEEGEDEKDEETKKRARWKPGVRTALAIQDVRLNPDAAWEPAPTWSPDGKRLAWVDGESGFAELVVANADGSDARRITSFRSTVSNPAWSPELPRSPGEGRQR